MSQCFDVHLSHSESILASAHFDGAVRLWSGRTFEPMSELKGVHDDLITCVRITPDEKCMVTTSK